jgi:2,5-diketo-D-gluconate reductase B
MQIPTIKLADGNSIPLLGLGTWQLTGNACTVATKTAIELGYNHIDTANYYGNQKEIAKAITGKKRSDLYITSKLWMTELTKKAVPIACHKILSELQTDYIDLLLIHWPNPLVKLKKHCKQWQNCKNKAKLAALELAILLSSI